MKQFEVGKTYQMSSACNADCIWEYVVVDRTAKTITIQSTHNSTIKKCRVHIAESNVCDAETVFPLGNYAMCPKLRADSQKIVPEDLEQHQLNVEYTNLQKAILLLTKSMCVMPMDSSRRLKAQNTLNDFKKRREELKSKGAQLILKI